MDSLPMTRRGLGKLRRPCVLRRIPVALGAVTTLLAIAAPAGQASALHVIPFPGTPDASPAATVTPAAAGDLPRGSSSPTGGGGQTLSFRSAPQLHPPALTLTRDPDRSSGDIFLTPIYFAPNANSQVGPLILDSQGNVVWFHPLSLGQQAQNLQVQSYNGQRVLTWWKGHLDSTHGTIFGVGQDVIMNSSYRTVAVVRGGDGYPADLHEFQITPQGTALLDEYVPVRVNGPGSPAVLDCVVQEVDIKSGKVLWEWHSLGHVPLSASHIPQPKNPSDYFDYFHINSIQQLPDGNLLISARSTWSIYEISRATGKVIWTLGGKRSSFKMGPGTGFEWQHDARMHPGGILSLFDDASLPQEEPEASAKLLKINTKSMTARLIHRYPHNPPLLPGLAGDAQVLPNHNIFVGWGGAPDFSEYTPDGRQIFNGSFEPGVLSYRALRFTWTGHPLTRPAMVSVPGHGGAVKVYASWNGATQVVRWQVLAGRRPGALHLVGQARLRRGFQTVLRVRTDARYLAVQALDSRGLVLGTSRAELRHG
jgi:hypothetical protein